MMNSNHSILLGDVMKNAIHILGIISLLCFSFYFTYQVGLFMKTNNPVYESILVMKKDYEKSPVDAKIMDEYIIPGLNGEAINLDKSYQKMQKKGVLDINKIVYEATEPSISLKNNKEKIIYLGNPSKEGVSIVVDHENFSVYFDEIGISYAILANISNLNHHYEYGEKINNDKNHYEEVEDKLKKKGEITLYCYAKNMGSDFCLQHNKYSFLESKRINMQNFLEEYNKISSGNIIFIDKSVPISYLKVLIHQIEFKGLKILPLSKLLSEERL